MPIVGIFVIIALSYFIGFLGRNRKFGFWGYFFASMVLTPLIGLLLVVATDPIKEKDSENRRGKKVFKLARKDQIVDGDTNPK
jgi:hypothetical protein